jgi:hypothetical protein
VACAGDQRPPCVLSVVGEFVTASVADRRSAPDHRPALEQRRHFSGTLRAGIDPSLNQLAGQILSTGRGVAASSRVPAPSDQIVLRHMRLQQREVAPAIAVTILHLPADIADRFAFPRHLDRRQLPARMSRNAPVGCALVQREVVIGMAGRATVAGDPQPILTTPSRRLVRIALGGLAAALTTLLPPLRRWNWAGLRLRTCKNHAGRAAGHRNQLG